ncbi:BREX-1 system adenine-specific DNA-methyltransferase PglX [Bacillus sp. FSL H8-0515]|uniref:BREX-1 system adenine-specific DNA-methyltransferase PglX n=1 Tax=Bacillus sp. FSL H8-0515 TaxID=2921396 RepID=UPI0030F7E891
MNKTELKNFAIQSRRQLIDQVKTKAQMYGIDEKNGLEIKEQFGQLMINNKPYPLYMKPAFNSLKNQLKQKGYKQLVEEVAYTWFNRIIAIRYMEVHDYLPEKVNVLSSSVGRVDPDILFEYETMDLPVKQEEIRELLDAGDTEGAYRKLFIAQCNTLNSILPFLFEQIQDYTELLLPDFLLDAESVIKVLVQNDELTNSFQEIEVIGWLYQYYISEEKDRVFKKDSKYIKSEIPAATQLFTPKWIVQYMVQNSLGRYWTEAHRKDEDLIGNWDYYIKHEEVDFYEKIAPYINNDLKVEDIKLLDPAMGSGHILVYAFEVFYQIYEKSGYPVGEIPRLIIENNLYGLDIDDRAYQLAAFAIVMKAASYSRRFLRSIQRKAIQLNLASIQETNSISDDVIAYLAQKESGEIFNELERFFKQYHNAKTYGSLIDITESNTTFLQERLIQIQNNPVEDLFYVEQHDKVKEILPSLIHQTKIMRNEYDIVVMNPPYMGTKKMEKNLADYINKQYPNNNQDLFSAMMVTMMEGVKTNGFIAEIAPHSWMFLTTYNKFRNKVLKDFYIDSLIHLGTDAFEELNGEVVQTASTVFRKTPHLNLEGHYKRLVDINSAEGKRRGFFNSNNDYKFNQNLAHHIDESPISYWASDKVREIFSSNTSLGNVAEVKKGMFTGKNEMFLRLWFEVDKNKIGFNFPSVTLAHQSNFLYYPLNKGGTFRKWYGNQEYVIKFDRTNYAAIAKNGGHRSPQFYFNEALTWTKVTNNGLSVRYSSEGYINNDASMAMYKKDLDLLILLGFLNSKVAKYLLSFISPTMNYNQGDLVRIPVNLKMKEHQEAIVEIVKSCLDIAMRDWNSQETSWDFEMDLLLKNTKSSRISESYETYVMESENEIAELKNLQSKLDSIFCDVYGIEEDILEATGEEVLSKRCYSREELTKNFLSYFVGYVLGRFNESPKYPILTITEKQYFHEDIIEILKLFLKDNFSEETINENLEWLASSLKKRKNESPETTLRKYFLDEFFKEHCKIYQKRPIYWLIDSGKQRGLRTLIYMHNYQPDTMATIRFEHLQEIQAKYQNEITDLENRLVNPSLSASEKKKLTAEKISFEKKMDELREFDIRLAEIANEEIEIDLDDGVKVNYEKFYRAGKGVLAKIK